MKYSETALQKWTIPASDSEEKRIENTISMIKSAINGSEALKGLEIDVFVQGSYANNTNVRANSDVDVCVMLTSTFYTEYPVGKSREDYGFLPGTISFEEYKGLIKSAITKKFGSDTVFEGNKSLKVRSNSYHVNADVVVAFRLQNYSIINSTDKTIFVEGIRFYAKDGTEVTNYPKDHIKNGIEKNKATHFRYKHLVRVFKRIRNEMVDDKKVNGDIISSFLIECLIWNVPNEIITGYSSWTETIKQAIIYLHNAIIDGKSKEWGEVSERFYLFHPGRKWTAGDAQLFLKSMYEYLEY